MKLGLGTVQFGLDYGVSNTEGKTTPAEVATILKLAASSGITVVDTAAMYGASEAVLGPILSSMDHPLDIVTKTPRFDVTSLTPADATRLEQTFMQSLATLKAPSLYGLLFHHADDLLAEGAALLVEKTLELKRRGLIKKWGFSAYTGQQIDAILSRFIPDVIQVPVNILDQRLINGGQLKRLKQAGVEVHSRSTFLQGLLLMNPESLHPYFSPYRNLLASLSREAVSHGLSPLQVALKFVMDMEEIDHVIVGVCSSGELRHILDTVHSLPECSIDYRRFASNDEGLLNPALWRLH